MENHVVDGKREKGVGLATEVGNAILDRGINNWVAVEFVRDGFVVALEKVLVDAIVVAKKFQCGLETLRECIDGCSVEALVIHAAHFENQTELACFREEHFGADESVEVHTLIERAGLLVVLEDSFKPEHGHPCKR